MENSEMKNDKSKEQDSEVFEPVEITDAPAADQQAPQDQPSSTQDESATPQDQSSASDCDCEKTAKEVEELKLQTAEMSDRYIRLMAEFDNYKKRISREYERQVDSANEKLMVEMVEVRENFERALRSGADDNTIFEGMKLIFGKFDSVLSRNGLEPFGAVGELFDPQIHDALMKTPKEGIPEDHIAEIYERGYKIKSKVIKHAKVIVSTGAPAPLDNAETLDN
jgi:molecular chaperone GrpE